jgi:hypothetical protein
MDWLPFDFSEGSKMILPDKDYTVNTSIQKREGRDEQNKRDKSNVHGGCVYFLFFHLFSTSGG